MPPTPAKPPRTDAQTGLLAALAAYGAWGFFPVFFRWLHPAGSFEVLAHRIVWSGVFLMVIFAATGNWGWVTALRTDRTVRTRSWLAGALVSVNWLVYLLAVNAERVVDASLGYFINPLVTVILGMVLLGETIRPLQRFALTVAALAVVVLAVGYGEFPYIGIVLALTWGFYGYIKRGTNLDALGSLAAETTILWPFAIGGLVWAMATGHASFATGDLGLDGRLLLAGPVTALPLVLFGIAAPKLPMVTIGLMQYIVPITQLILGVWLYGEAMPPARLAGFALIWVAVIALVIDGLRSRSTTTTKVTVEA